MTTKEERRLSDKYRRAVLKVSPTARMSRMTSISYGVCFGVVHGSPEELVSGETSTRVMYAWEEAARVLCPEVVEE